MTENLQGTSNLQGAGAALIISNFVISFSFLVIIAACNSFHVDSTLPVLLSNERYTYNVLILELN